jgi:pSer/pThr/pTyr-binding forkhead associated (FHA) protein
MKQYTNAWLVDVNTNTSYQLLRHDTMIGRATDNDIVVAGDETVSRHHIMIRCNGPEFILMIQEARVLPKVNGIIVEGRQYLRHNDVITLTERTSYHLITDH